MTRRLLSLALILSLAAPAAAGAGVCCPTPDLATSSWAADSCCCPEARVCADERSDAMLPDRLVTAASAELTTAALPNDRRSASSCASSHSLHIASARSPDTHRPALNPPLRL